MNEKTGLKEDKKRRYGLKFALLGAALLVAVLLSFGVGYYPLSPTQVVQALAKGLGFEAEALPQAMTIFWSIRLPRILAAVLIGAALSVSGTVYQGMFRNPLVSPDILGVSAGAGLGAAIAIFAGFPYASIQLFAFVGGAGAVALCYLISLKSVHFQTLSLVLTGTMITALCNAVVTMIKYIANPSDVLQQLTFWLMGSLAKVTMHSVAISAVPMAIGIAVIWALRWRVNLLSLDDEEAQSLGITPRRYRLVMIAAATLLSASAVCLGGLIGFVGLMVPHLCRSLFGADFNRLVPAGALVGALYLLLMDDAARSLFAMELPIGVATAFVGAPFFIWLILRRRGA